MLQLKIYHSRRGPVLGFECALEIMPASVSTHLRSVQYFKDITNRQSSLRFFAFQRPPFGYQSLSWVLMGFKFRDKSFHVVGAQRWNRYQPGDLFLSAIGWLNHYGLANNRFSETVSLHCRYRSSLTFVKGSWISIIVVYESIMISGCFHDIRCTTSTSFDYYTWYRPDINLI